MTRTVAVVITALFGAGCGGAEELERPSAKVTLDQRIAQIDADPYQLTCGDQAKSALMRAGF